jgi:hypothetical protein
MKYLSHCTNRTENDQSGEMIPFTLSVSDILASEFRSSSTFCPESENLRSDPGLFLPKDYESLPIFSYNIDTTKNLTWESDAQRLHELWMKNAKTGGPHDQYPHAAIKRLMRLNPEVFQVCSEVLAPFSLLADMFAGMLLLGACDETQKQPTVLTEKKVIQSSIAPNPLLIWALDAINIDVLLDTQTNEDYTVLANFLPELLFRQYPKRIKKKLIEAHFRLLDASQGTLGEIPQFIDASGHAITRSDVLGSEISEDQQHGSTGISQNVETSRHAQVSGSIIEHEQNKDRFEVSVDAAENQFTALHDETPNLHHISDLAMSSQYNLAELCRDSNSNAVSFQMEYVNFFSQIDPIWFPNEVDDMP